MLEIARDTLFQFLASDEQLLSAAHDVLFLRAQNCSQLNLFAGKNLVCQQSFKPEYELLEKRGFSPVTEFTGKVDLCLCLGSRQRDENFIQFANGIDALSEGGTFLCCLPKELGAGRFERELKRVGGESILFVKNHCRVFGLKRSGPLDEAVLAEWRALAELRPIPETKLLSRPGIFGWDKIDQGSKLLVSQLPELIGVVGDLGSGYGFLAQHVLQRGAALQELHLFEAEKLALDASQQSFAFHERAEKIRYHWHDVCAGLPKIKFDAIVCNPPFHSGKQVNVTLGEKFIVAAAGALKKEGQLYMVANSTLPYERTLQKHFRSFTQLAAERGFKVLQALK